jgi:Tfp pilus assembly pilus retraction ATPase PilT
MQTLDQHLAQLVHEGAITRQTAREVASNKTIF